MTMKPYQSVTVRDPQRVRDQPESLLYEIELADTPILSHQKERLLIQTIVSPPLPNHQQEVVLAALLRVRALLGEQIEAMQSL
jgi:hypothetical protein